MKLVQRQCRCWASPCSPDARWRHERGGRAGQQVRRRENEMREREGEGPARLSPEGRGQEPRGRSHLHRQGRHQVQRLHREAGGETAVPHHQRRRDARGRDRRLRARRRPGPRSRLPDAGHEQVLRRQEEGRRRQDRREARVPGRRRSAKSPARSIRPASRRPRPGSPGPGRRPRPNSPCLTTGDEAALETKVDVFYSEYVRHAGRRPLRERQPTTPAGLRRVRAVVGVGAVRTRVHLHGLQLRVSDDDHVRGRRGGAREHSRFGLDRHLAPGADRQQRRRDGQPELRGDQSPVRHLRREWTDRQYRQRQAREPTVQRRYRRAVHERARRRSRPSAPVSGRASSRFGSHLSLAAGGVTTCVTNQFNGPVNGTANVESGEAATTAS